MYHLFFLGSINQSIERIFTYILSYYLHYYASEQLVGHLILHLRKPQPGVTRCLWLCLKAAAGPFAERVGKRLGSVRLRRYGDSALRSCLNPAVRQQ
jgi:hypothetical protein